MGYTFISQIICSTPEETSTAAGPEDPLFGDKDIFNIGSTYKLRASCLESSSCKRVQVTWSGSLTPHCSCLCFVTLLTFPQKWKIIAYAIYR